MKRNFGRLLGVILAGVLVVSILAGCGNNGQVSSNSGQTTSQPAPTANSSVAKQEVKDPNPVDSNKAVKELGIFEDQKNWENAKIGGPSWSGAEIFFNVPAGEKITFPFDIIAKYQKTFDSGDVIDSSTNVKKETSLDILNISALRPQSDGTLKAQYMFKIVFSWSLSGMENNKEIMIPAGETVTTVPKTNLYMTKHVSAEVTNKANVGVWFYGTDSSTATALHGYDRVIEISRNLLPSDYYRAYLEAYLKYDKNMAAGEGEKKD